jgi:hypothetical protein
LEPKGNDKGSISLIWEKTDSSLVSPGAEFSNQILTGLKAESGDHGYKSKLFFSENIKGSKITLRKRKQLTKGNRKTSSSN